MVALVSDAGTPLLSDPGFALVRAAAAAGIEVRAVPGASAVTAALSIAGLPTDRFVFEGFLPARAARAAHALLARLAAEPRTLVFFEAPHRIAATLSDMAAQFGAERLAVVARELTKTARERVSRHAAASSRAHGARRMRIFSAARSPSWSAGAAPERAGGVDAGSCWHARCSCCWRELPPARAAAIAAQLAGATAQRGLCAGAAAAARAGRSGS